MEIFRFERCGMHAAFGIGQDGQLLMLGLADREIERLPEESALLRALEVTITGCNPDDNHGGKHSGGCSPYDLKYEGHSCTDTELVFDLRSRLLHAQLHYEFSPKARVVRVWSTLTNICDEDVGLEYVSSFCLYGFQMKQVMLAHNGWCREMDWRAYEPAQLGFSPINKFSHRRICASNTGTWSTKEYLPMGCIQGGGSTLLWQIEHNGSWNWEISDVVYLPYLKLSGPSERENGWWKRLRPGETFTTVTAAVCSVTGGFDRAVEEMTAYRRSIACRSPSDRSLPVIFNDFMNCLLADPTTERELPVIDAAAAAGAEYFVMDAGWYADGTWWDTVGEWKTCEKRFPGGLDKVFDYVRSKGMVAGIWLEPESIGINCPILDQFDDSCFFMRHGTRVVDHGRYQFDFRNPKVRSFMDGVVDRLIRDYGVGYFKFDYNIEGGPGTEVDSDSFGDGLMQHNEAYLDWVDGVMERYPDLVIENCSSGGMRMDYKSLSHFSLQSLSDATNYKDNSKIAAMSSAAVLPEQAAVWCLPMKEQTPAQIAAGMVSAMFRRIHLSGETPWLAPEQFDMVREGVQFYKSTRHMINEMTPVYPLGLVHFEDEVKCCGYRWQDKLFLCLVNVDGREQTVPVPAEGAIMAKIVYPMKNNARVELTTDTVTVELPGQSGVIVCVDIK